MAFSDKEVCRQNAGSDDLKKIFLTVARGADAFKSEFEWILKRVVFIGICIPRHGTFFQAIIEALEELWCAS